MGKLLFKWSILIAFISISKCVEGIEIDSSKVYIKNMDDYWSFKVGLNNDFQEFKVNSDNHSYHLRPNIENLLSFSTHYKLLSISFSYAPQWMLGNNDNELKGNTFFLNFGSNFTYNHWIQDISYQYNKGFYLVNTKDYIPNWSINKQPYIQFPHLIYSGVQGRTGYSINNRFSADAIASQTQRQLKSAGTFIPQASYRYYIVDNQEALTDNNSTQKSNNFEFSLSMAYFYTFVYRSKFYLNAGLGGGGGKIFTKLQTRASEETINTSMRNAIYYLNGSIALGYNSERFFMGTQLLSSRTGYNQSHQAVLILNDRFTYQVFIGYRFNAPDYLKTTYNKIWNQIPFIH